MEYGDMHELESGQVKAYFGVILSLTVSLPIKTPFTHQRHQSKCGGAVLHMNTYGRFSTLEGSTTSFLRGGGAFSFFFATTGAGALPSLSESSSAAKKLDWKKRDELEIATHVELEKLFLRR
jgi:hypothetical protein